MTKKKLSWLLVPLFLLMLPATGCQYWENMTNSGSGSSSTSGSALHFHHPVGAAGPRAGNGQFDGKVPF